MLNQNAIKLAVVKTNVNPDSCKWITTTSNQSLILCGCYKLLENSTCSNTRTGSIYLYNYEDSKITILDEMVDLPGVLAIELIDKKSKFLTAFSDGSVGLFQIVIKSKSILELCLNICLTHDTVWYCTSMGSVGHATLSNSELILTKRYHSKDKMECWSVRSSPQCPNIAYSSYDDGRICTWDKNKPSFVNIFPKVHTFGVCHLSFPNENDYNLLCASGFDDKMSFWDVRNIKSTLSQIDNNFSGWNLNWADNEVACISAMLNGCIIASFDSNYSQITEIAHFHELDSLMYSCDMKIDNKQSLYCSTGFYDRNLFVWKKEL